MKTQPKQVRFLLILIAAQVVSLLAACAPGDSTPTATAMSVEAIYTSAAQTIVAQISQTAAARPSATITSTSTLTPTGTVTPTGTKAVPLYIAPPAVIVSPTTSGTPGPSPTATFGAVGCNDSAFLSDITIPDGTTIPAGGAFTKTWSLKNTGTCSWNSNFKFTFIGGDLMGSDTFKIRQVVGPGSSAQVSTGFTAPVGPGTYTGYWRMADDTGVLFGTLFTVSIKVAGATFTPVTPVIPSLTPSPVAPTNTPLPSNTPIPSNTPAAPTDTAVPSAIP